MAAPTQDWDATVADLHAEASYLARRLNQPLVRTPGAAGILNRLAPSAIWVHGSVDPTALLSELDGWWPAPEVMLPEPTPELTDALTALGWDTDVVVERFQRELPRHFPVSAPSSVGIRPATLQDMPQLRALHLQVFGTDHFLPVEILEVPRLRLLVAEAPDTREAVGVAGVRLRHQGALLFGLGTMPAHRRRGVATALVETCLAWAAARRAPFALAEVDAPAPALWARLGFRSTGRWRRCAPPELSRKS